MTTAPFGTANGRPVTYRTDEHHTFIVCGPADRAALPIRAVVGAVLTDGHLAHLIDIRHGGEQVAFAAQHLASIATNLTAAREVIDRTFTEVARRRTVGVTDDDPDLFLVVLNADALLPNPVTEPDDVVATKHAISVNLGYIGVAGYTHRVHLILSADTEDRLLRFPGAPFHSLTAHMNEVDATVHDGVEYVSFEPARPDPETLRQALHAFVPLPTTGHPL
ncbi:hypothetical protein [Curtobacterium sp. MCBD17_040]|uniref:hypothetical protein n=1 Tax=Curtobacterium sp. MCBD17_040 TaxID=2175674 RepID=UPI000DA7FBFC|nr:hypothetical protein [Curtobacterium sp. MCBD17_040]WIB65689.1 hypothetical protein DEI94_16340 [Curtobacterium sp. MCBD17_040]